MSDPIIIVGAGVSGLRIASILTSKGIACKVFEARDRVGGRVLSEAVGAKADLDKFDLGPTWFWPLREPVITSLVNELNLQVFEQHTQGEILYVPSENSPIQRHVLPEEADPKSMRIVGGITSLVDMMTATIPQGVIELSTQVQEVHQDEQGKLSVQVRCANGYEKRIHAKAVVLALPPRLIAKNITFSPALPPEMKASFESKSTWMGGQAKAIAVYERPFWRENGLSGQVVSRVGLLQEIHDASPMKGQGALFGFFGMSSKHRQALGEKKVRELVVAQLIQLFGPAAAKPVALLYKDWSSDARTAVEADSEPLTDFPDYSLPSSPTSWTNKIILAGTETSAESGGHLEGALLSAERAASSVLELFE